MNQDISRLYAIAADLAAFGRQAQIEESVLPIRAASERDERRQAKSYLTPRQRIDGPATGAAYAAKIMGEVIAACGGLKLMADVHSHVEEHVGEQQAEWLSRRWVGIEADGEHWSD